MDEQEFYYTIGSSAVAEFKDRGSKFIAYTFPVGSVDQFKQRLEETRKEHPKASHHCFAYRIGLDNNVFRASDDGEPSGTAGKPILGQIDSKKLTDTLIIVVRYFGGTLLGVPGLINAYRSAAAMALQLTPVVRKVIEVTYLLQYDYTQMNEVMTIVKQLNCTVLNHEMNLFCQLTVGIPKTRMEEAMYKLKEIRNLEINLVK